MTDDDWLWFTQGGEEALDQALATVLPDMQPGDRVTVHDGGCAVEEGADCDCDVLVVYGPSGKA